MRTTFAAIATAAALTLALSGCTESEPREPEPSWTPSSTPEQPSTTPAAHDSLTVAPEGETARQFIRRFVALGNEMQRTGETAAFLTVTGPDCRSCRNFAERVERIYTNGGSIETNGSEVIQSQHDGGDQWTVTLEGAPTRIRETRTGAPRAMPGGQYQLVVFIAKVDGHWVVGEFQDKQ